MTIWAPFTKSPNCASHSDERVLVDDRVAVLEADGGVLGQQRVVDPELAPGPGRACASGTHVRAGLVVDQHGVALAERAPPGVLAGQPHVGALEQQRAERQRLGQWPTRPRPRSWYSFVRVVELPGQLRVEREALGERR